MYYGFMKIHHFPQISAPQIKNKNNTSKKKVKLYPWLGVEPIYNYHENSRKNKKAVYHFFSLEVCISAITMEVKDSWIFDILLFSWVIARTFGNQVIWTRKLGFIRIIHSFKFHSTHTCTRSHRICWVGRNLQGPSSPTPDPAQHHPQKPHHVPETIV